MNFITQCLYCGRENHSKTYQCDCRPESWMEQYRVLQIKWRGKDFNDSIRRSFEDYKLSDPEGIYQYEGIPNLECKDPLFDTIGNTDLFQVPVLSTKLKASIYIKNEGQNPSGCFKDRETLCCFLNSRCNGINKAVIYSSGNAAASASLFAQFTDMELIAFVPGDTYREKIDYIQDHGSNVIVVGDEHTNFETGFRLYSELVTDRIFIDAKYDDWSVRNPFRVEGDKTTAIEIVKQLGKDNVPDYIIVPTANGSCLAGIWKGFKELYNAGIIQKLPKMISVGIKSGNPVYKAVKKEILLEPVSRSMKNVDKEDAKMGSIILAEEGYDSIQAASAVQESDGHAFEVTSSEIKTFYNELYADDRAITLEHNLLPEPASVISLAAIPKLLDKVDVKTPKIVSILTGHGMKAKSKVSQLIRDDHIINTIVNPFIEKKKKNSPGQAAMRGKQLKVPARKSCMENAFKRLSEIH